MTRGTKVFIAIFIFSYCFECSIEVMGKKRRIIVFGEVRMFFCLLKFYTWQNILVPKEEYKLYSSPQENFLSRSIMSDSL